MINLIIPMAGRGSRFNKQGFKQPKPLLELFGKPFFWWAIESVKRVVPAEHIICVILKEHVTEFNIDKVIKKYYPGVTLVVIDEVTDGALDTAVIGINSLKNDLPIIINDCDQAFMMDRMESAIDVLSSNPGLQGYLCHFDSNSPSYSYAEYDSEGNLLRTAEKKVISNKAISGVYIFRSKKIIENYYNTYKKNCQYTETYISGLYNIIVSEGGTIKGINLREHLSFGTPEEYRSAILNKSFLSWLDGGAK